MDKYLNPTLYMDEIHYLGPYLNAGLTNLCWLKSLQVTFLANGQYILKATLLLSI